MMFTLKIHTRTSSFGETDMNERSAIAGILKQAAQQIGSGAAFTPLKCSDGHVVGEFSFGAGMLNGDGTIDRTNMSLPSAHAGAPPGHQVKRDHRLDDVHNGRIIRTFAEASPPPFPGQRPAGDSGSAT